MAEPIKPGHEMGADGGLVGCDPREMTVDELDALGHKRMSPLKALRLRCLDCCGGSSPEVRMCVAVSCPSWPFRMGTNPYRTKRTLSEEHRAEMAARLAHSRSPRPIGQGRRREVALGGTQTPETRDPPVAVAMSAAES